ncbi:unnamed protein product, partial [Owenia fusiformis]
MMGTVLPVHYIGVVEIIETLLQALILNISNGRVEKLGINLLEVLHNTLDQSNEDYLLSHVKKEQITNDSMDEYGNIQTTPNENLEILKSFCSMTADDLSKSQQEKLAEDHIHQSIDDTSTDQAEIVNANHMSLTTEPLKITISPKKPRKKRTLIKKKETSDNEVTSTKRKRKSKKQTPIKIKLKDEDLSNQEDDEEDLDETVDNNTDVSFSVEYPLDKKFMCMLCRETECRFSTIGALSVHIKVEHAVDEERLNCFDCSFISQCTSHQESKMPYFAAYLMLIKHMRDEHKLAVPDDVFLENCPECPYIPFTLRDLQKHNQLIHLNNLHGLRNVKSYKCFLCEPTKEQNFDDQKQFHNHVRADHTKTVDLLTGKREMKCPYCDFSQVQNQVKDKKVLKNPRILNIRLIRMAIHMTKAHNLEQPEYIPMFKCDQCEYQTNLFRNLKLHKRLCKTKQFRPRSVCEICGNSVLKANMNAHIKNKHTLGDIKPHQCPDCGELYKHKITLTQHIQRKHMGMDDDVHMCTICAHTVKSRASLDQHMLHSHNTVTSKREALSCQHCDNYKTYSKSKLQIHILRHHNSNERTYQCPECQKFYKTTADLNYHIKRYHKNRGTFPCPQCPYVSHLKLYLDRHMQIHDGTKHPCPICDYSTTFRENLTKHIKNVHKVSTVGMMKKDALTSPSIKLGQSFEMQDTSMNFDHNARLKLNPK